VTIEASERQQKRGNDEVLERTGKFVEGPRAKDECVPRIWVRRHSGKLLMQAGRARYVSPLFWGVITEDVWLPLLAEKAIVSNSIPVSPYLSPRSKAPTHPYPTLSTLTHAYLICYSGFTKPDYATAQCGKARPDCTR